MITDSYRGEEESIISPGAFLGERKYICDTAIATFSGEIFNSVLEKYPHKEVACVGTTNGSKSVYLLDINGKNAVFYLSAIGSALAGNDIIEISWQTGIKNLIIFGSAGSLDNEATDGKYVIPRIWTTDAPYRETKTALAERKKDGCIAVEMEVAGVQAVCDFYGIELYSFLITGDVLDPDEYKPEGLAYANHSRDKFFTALKILGCIC